MGHYIKALVRAYNTLLFWSRHPSRYWPRSTLIIFGDQTGTVVLIAVCSGWICYNEFSTWNKEFEQSNWTQDRCAKRTFAKHYKRLQTPDTDLTIRFMFLNSLVRSRLLHTWHGMHPTLSEMYKLWTIYEPFLRSMMKNSFKRMNLINLKENDPLSDAMCS